MRCAVMGKKCCKVKKPFKSKKSCEEKKFLVEYEKTKEIFTCPPSQLTDKIRESFKIQQPFKLQVYDDGLKEWADVSDIEKHPTSSKLQVLISKN